jgi:transcriptional regulator with XRE-family HTH domain
MRIDDAAEMLGVSKDTLSRIENGRSVSADRLFLVLRGLGLVVLVLDKWQADALLHERGSASQARPEDA